MKCINNTSEQLNGNVFTPVKKFIEEKFLKDRSLRNTVIVVGYNQGVKFREVKRKNKNKKIIVYQLEQLYNYSSLWYNPKSEEPMVQKRTVHIQEWLDGVDEIWDYDLDNVEFLKSLGFKNIKHVPLEICNNVKYENKIGKPEYDIVFYGALNERRMEYLRLLDDKYKLLVVCHQGNRKMKGYEFKNTVKHCFGQELFNHIFNAKIAINLHYYEGCLQEQVRLFELLSNNVKVISEKSKINYLNVPEFETQEQMIKLIDKHLDDNIKIGVAINSFYGLNILKKNIHKIKKGVDYIVMVHQKIGFSGDVEPSENDEIIKYFLDNNLINDIVYYENQGDDPNQMFNKRNIGLQYCKDNDCDWIIPLDTDECYDFDALRQEMIHSNVDSLYSPIQTYYYNDEYYYKDYFYVASGYKINDRKFELVRTSLVIDPHRKMREGKYRLTDIPLLHYNYIFSEYEIKINNKLFCPSEICKEIYDYLKIWKPGKQAKIIGLENGIRIFKYIDLMKDDNLIKGGATSYLEIKDNKVKKIVDYNKYTKELLDREEYWLKKLESFNITPKFIERDENSITMSYCGNVATENDFKTPHIQHQLLNILRVLLENKCFYNDFKIDNFTVLNNKLYIIDFGWCPEIKEDFTCGRFTESQLKTKPHKNIYNLFDINFKTE